MLKWKTFWVECGPHFLKIDSPRAWLAARVLFSEKNIDILAAKKCKEAFYAKFSISQYGNGSTLRRFMKKNGLLETDEIFQKLLNLIKPNVLIDWMYESNPSLANYTPMDLIERSETAELEKLLYICESGIPL